jgi:hypothetical protein
VLPPQPSVAAAAMATTAAAGELRTSGAVPKAKGGIPWNDSPKMPAPVPFQLPPNPLAGVTVPRPSGGVTPAPQRMTGAGAPSAAPSRGDSVPELRPHGAGGVRVLRGVRHTDRFGGLGRQRPIGQPRTMFIGGYGRGSVARAGPRAGGSS